jgi:putative membrane protein
MVSAFLAGVSAAGAPALAEDTSPSPPRSTSSGAIPRLKPGANSFAESQARALIESHGFSEVSPLINDKTGIWRGTARQGDRVVDVGVDFQGNVAVQ